MSLYSGTQIKLWLVYPPAGMNASTVAWQTIVFTSLCFAFHAETVSNDLLGGLLLRQGNSL